MWEFVSCKKCAHCGVSGKAACTRVKTLMTRANQFIDYYIIRTVQCCPASPARTSVCMWTYVRGFTHTCERTSYSRMLGVIIYKKPHGSQRRGYQSRCYWRSIVRVYIFRELAANHWWLSDMISYIGRKQTRNVLRNSTIIKLITLVLLYADIGFYNICEW